METKILNQQTDLDEELDTWEEEQEDEEFEYIDVPEDDKEEKFDF